MLFKKITGSPPKMVEFTIIISLIMSLVALSIDAILPVMDIIGDDLLVSQRNDLQFILSFLFLGMALGQIFFGPLSDSIGRKPAIYIGFLMFMVGCLIAFFAQTFEWLLVGRLLQGIGASSPRTVIIALVRDNYSGPAMARVMSFAISVFILVPIVAPAFGQWVAGFAGWRGIFASFFIFTLVLLVWIALRLPESLPIEKRHPFSIARIRKSLTYILSHSVVWGYTLAMSFLFGAFIAYLSLSQKIFQVQYNLGSDFPLYFGLLSSAIGLAALTNASLVMRVGMQILCEIAMLSAFLLSLLFLTVAYYYHGIPPLLWLMIYLFMLLFFIGILFCNLSTLAMQPLGNEAGVGSAFIGSVSTLLSVIFGAIISDAYNGTIFSLVIGFVILCFFGLITMRLTAKYSLTLSS
jgi:DHA1 family bicyclomycin/chloramphenicol resistance-like MFS transporter